MRRTAPRSQGRRSGWHRDRDTAGSGCAARRRGSRRGEGRERRGALSGAGGVLPFALRRDHVLAPLVGPDPGTGRCDTVFNDDRSKPKPWKKQDPLEFYENVKQHVVHVHVKDSVSRPSEKHPFTYVLPGEGEFPAVGLFAALRVDGYTGVVSLEW